MSILLEKSQYDPRSRRTSVIFPQNPRTRPSRTIPREQMSPFRQWILDNNNIQEKITLFLGMELRLGSRVLRQ